MVQVDTTLLHPVPVATWKSSLLHGCYCVSVCACCNTHDFTKCFLFLRSSRFVSMSLISSYNALALTVIHRSFKALDVLLRCRRYRRAPGLALVYACRFGRENIVYVVSWYLTWYLTWYTTWYLTWYLTCMYLPLATMDVILPTDLFSFAALLVLGTLHTVTPILLMCCMLCLVLRLLFRLWLWYTVCGSQVPIAQPMRRCLSR